METIKSYLENMFMNLPRTAQINKAKAELMTMMEDKYNELKAEGKTENEAIGIVISEFGNLDELAEELGIRDYLNNAGNQPQGRIVTLSEAKEYINMTMKCASKIAIGVLLCVCSPITLIILGGIQGVNNATSDALACGIGIPVLLCMVAAAVGLFIFYGMKLSKYEDLQKESFQLDYQTDTYVKQQKEQTSGEFAIRITVGVILCIVGIIPIIIIGTLLENQEFLVCVSVGLFLFMVAIATQFFINAGMERGAYRILLQQDEYAPGVKDNPVVGNIGAVYWPIVVCIYLAWSFITGDWGITWIIWPITGVLFGAISSICNAVHRGNQQK